MVVHINKSFKCNEEAKELLTHGQDLNIIQLSAGDYYHDTQVLILDGMIIHKRNMSNKTLVTGTVVHDSLVFLILNPNNYLKINGQKITTSNFAIASPREELSVFCPEFHSGILIDIKWQTLLKHLGEELLQSLNVQAFKIRNPKFNNPYAQQLNFKAYQMCFYLLNNYLTIGKQALLDYQFELVDDISRHLQLMPYKKLPQSSQIQQKNRIIKRSIDYIHTHNHISFNTYDIAKHACCSIRTLEYAFKQVLSLTPKQYIIYKRLNMIRTEFKSHPNAYIKDILIKYGVINFGRFSQDYYQLFGEYPKDTVKKADANIGCSLFKS